MADHVFYKNLVRTEILNNTCHRKISQSLEAARIVFRFPRSSSNSRGVFQISRRSANPKHKSHGFETSRDLTINRLMSPEAAHRNSHWDDKSNVNTGVVPTMGVNPLKPILTMSGQLEAHLTYIGAETNGRHFADCIFKCIFSNKTFAFQMNFD